MRWWTADLHFGHANIIKYCNRPFGSVEEMDARLLERWNATVSAGDEIWVLGDWVLGNSASGGLGDHLHKMAGRKILVPGNHDACWAGRTKHLERRTREYLDAGFDEIIQPPTRTVVAGTPVLVHHFPYHGDSKDTGDRFVEHRLADEGDWLLHGHIHDRWLQLDRQINVGVDAWGGRPVAEGELAELIAAGPANLDPLPWD